MACTHDHNGTSTSPNSSEEVESHHGTPATKLSPFSPDQVLEDIKLINQGIVRARVPPPFVLARDQSNFGPNGKAGKSIVPGSQDPFLSVPNLSSNTQSSGDGSKLSPNASTFTPTSLIESVSSNGIFSSSTFQYPLSAPICGSGIQGLDFLSPVSRSNNLQYGPICTKYVLSGPKDTSISSTSMPAASSFSGLVTNVGSLKFGQFSTDLSKSRSLMAGPVSRATSAKEIEKLLGVSFVDIRSLWDDWRVLSIMWSHLRMMLCLLSWLSQACFMLDLRIFVTVERRIQPSKHTATNGMSSTSYHINLPWNSIPRNSDFLPCQCTRAKSWWRPSTQGCLNTLMPLPPDIVSKRRLKNTTV